MRHPLLLFQLTGGLLLYCQQTVTRSYSCEQPADLQALLGRPYLTAPGGSLQDSRNAQQERFQQLVVQYPGELWIQRSHVDRMTTMVWPVASEELVSEFKRRFDARPDDPETAYLHAYSLVGRNTPQAIQILAALAVKNPSYPFSWLTLANIHAYPGFSDRAKMQSYGEGFLARCPDSGDAVFLASRLNNSPRLSAFAKALRNRIAGKTGVESLRLYPYLWDLEYKVAAAAELTRVRKRVEQDLKFLNRLPLGDPVVRSALLEGYKLTFDKEAQDKLSAQAPHPPSSAPRAEVEAEQERPAANAAPPMARLWIERQSGSQDLGTMMRELLDRLRASILRVWQSDLYGFTMRDQGGKTWTFDSLKGKTTFINLWYTSCGPCRAELPYLQKLHEQIQDRSDMQVLTLNVDRDESLVRPFLDENQYTFPALYAWSVARLADGTIAPSSWILDASGAFRVEDAGFAGDGEQWLEQTLAQMERVRKGGP